MLIAGVSGSGKVPCLELLQDFGTMDLEKSPDPAMIQSISFRSGRIARQGRYETNCYTRALSYQIATMAHKTDGPCRLSNDVLSGPA